MVPSHRASAAPRRCSLSGIPMGLIEDYLLQATLRSDENKVMAGGTPANLATLAQAARRLRRGAALFPVYRWDLLDAWIRRAARGAHGYKVTAGVPPSMTLFSSLRSVA